MAFEFAGTWSYRSFRNAADLNINPNDLLFGMGTLIITEPSPGKVGGSLGGTGWSLALDGTMTSGDPMEIRFTGSGDIGGETWVYDYHGYMALEWPNGVDQIPAIVGSIIRTVPHSGGQAEAGYVASFYAVRQ